VDVVGYESDYSNEVSVTPIGIPVWYVSKSNGQDVNNNGTANSPFATIQQGIDVSLDGDSVLVVAGTYVENINFNGKNIVVQGADRETTIIDGGQNGCVVTIANGETSLAMLKNFTIQNGYYIEDTEGTEGAGIYIYQSHPYITNLIIKNNYSGGDYHGTGIRCVASNSIIENCIIKDNTGRKGSAIAVDGGRPNYQEYGNI